MKDFNQIYETNKNKFVRYGRLDIWNKHKNHVKNKKKSFNDEDDTEVCFHTPPISRGFYAMPYGYEEPFLIGALNTTQPDMFPDNFDDSDNPYNTFKQEWRTLPYDERKVEEEKWEKKCRDFDKRLVKWRKESYSKNRKIFTMKDSDLIWHHLEDKTPLNEIERRSGAWVQTTVKTFFKALKRSLRNNEGLSYSRDHLEVFISPFEH